MYDITTIGSSLRDTLFYSDRLYSVKNPNTDPTVAMILGAERGAKVASDNVHFGFGGGAANSAINCAGLGLRTAIITAVGADANGKELRNLFRSHHISVRSLEINTQATGTSFVLVDTPTGEHTAFVHYGAARELRAKHLTQLKSRWLYLTSIASSQWSELVQRVCAHAAQLAWNPGSTQLAAGYSGIKNFLQDTSVFIVNRDEATELVLSHPDHPTAGTVLQMAKTIHSWGPGMVVITDGLRGSLIYDGNYRYQDKPTPVTPVDTTGAGDCFGSSFVAGLVHYDGDVVRAQALATYAASQLVTKPGAQNGLVRWQDLPSQLI